MFCSMGLCRSRILLCVFGQRQQHIGKPDAAGIRDNYSARTVQAHAVLKQLGAILEAGGASYANVVRTTVLLTDMGQFQKVGFVLMPWLDSCIRLQA